jgi:glycyl-tRNA synthetase
VREFEQMELEFFCKPGTDLEWFQPTGASSATTGCWASACGRRTCACATTTPAELSFYSKATTDFEFVFPFGWGELWGVADRTDYDLTQHQKVSGKDMTYYDQETNEHYIPYVIEPSLGADRAVLAFLVEAYDEQTVGQGKVGKDDRVVLHFHPALAPFKAAVLPLSKKLSPARRRRSAASEKDFMVDYDDTGSIGKRYRREDEIGTPYCITVDFETVGDPEQGVAADNAASRSATATPWSRSACPISELKDYLSQKLAY